MRNNQVFLCRNRSQTKMSFTLARPNVFYKPKRGGVGTWRGLPRRFDHNWARASRKNEHVERDDTQQMMPKFKVLFQLMTSGQVNDPNVRFRVLINSFIKNDSKTKLCNHRVRLVLPRRMVYFLFRNGQYAWLTWGQGQLHSGQVKILD